MRKLQRRVSRSPFSQVTSDFNASKDLDLLDPAFRWFSWARSGPCPKGFGAGTIRAVRAADLPGFFVGKPLH